MKVFFGLFLLLFFANIVAQKKKTEALGWHKVEEMELGGKFDAQGANPFQRFPDSMKTLVRKPLWGLSKNPTGVFVDFETTSPEISIRYQVKGPTEFPHMPATGVSGVDLYTNDAAGWKWVKGNYSFQDTIRYRFNFKSSGNPLHNRHRLYLPLYNTVSWMELGVYKNSSFKGVPKETANQSWSTGLQLPRVPVPEDLEPPGLLFYPEKRISRC